MRQVTMAATALALSFLMCAAYVAFADQPARHERVVFASVDDLAAAVRVEKSAGELPSVAVDMAQGPSDGPEGQEEDEGDYVPELGETGPQIAPQGNPDGLNSHVGVIEHDGHVETYYATSAAYDDQLTVDEQGFYRDADGRYVVASSDHAIGEVIETSQGEAVVMDDGTAPGVVDMHVNWR